MDEAEALLYLELCSVASLNKQSLTDSLLGPSDHIHDEIMLSDDGLA